MKQRQIRVVWQWSIPAVDEYGDPRIDKPIKRKRFRSFAKAEAFIKWLVDTDAEDCPKLHGRWVNEQYMIDDDIQDYSYYEGDPAPKPDFAYIETRLVEYPKWEKHEIAH